MALLFILIGSPRIVDVRGVTNRKTIQEGYENVQAALLDYTLTCYSSVSVSINCNERSILRSELIAFVSFIAGKIQQAAQYYPGDPFNGIPRRGAPVHEALRGQCAHADAAHGDVARKEEIICRRERGGGSANLCSLIVFQRVKHLEDTMPL